jgi:hypothetical protein
MIAALPEPSTARVRAPAPCAAAFHLTAANEYYVAMISPLLC